MMAESEQTTKEIKKASSFVGFTLGIIVAILVLGAALGGAVADRYFKFEELDKFVDRVSEEVGTERVDVTQTILKEESVVIDVAEQASPSVVTVSITTEQRQLQPLSNDPFGGMFGRQFFQQGPVEEVERDIGSGFVVEEGLVVTNKHVVSNPDATYAVITKDDEHYEVTNIYRDPVNDLAILKIDDGDIPALEMGDSDSIKVGQFVIAIGTALGEFRHTVTTGVVSGLGRGITAGDIYGSFSEELSNVIQTDAAINPGNSGGPLLNSAGQVIGVSVAVAQGSENIGFAIPIKVVRDSLDNFNETGQFERPFLGVQYKMISQEIALMNDVPEGAYIVEVVPGSAADEARVEAGDIVVKLNNTNIKDADGGLAAVINTLKTGEKVTIEVFRDGEMKSLEVELKVVEEG